MLFRSWWRTSIADKPWLLKASILAIPLPYLALQAGWAVAEVGRQPWIVYGLLRTSEAHSHVIDPGQVWFSLITMCALYTVLGLAGFYLIAYHAAKGPHSPEKTAMPANAKE